MFLKFKPFRILVLLVLVTSVPAQGIGLKVHTQEYLRGDKGALQEKTDEQLKKKLVTSYAQFEISYRNYVRKEMQLEDAQVRLLAIDEEIAAKKAAIQEVSKDLPNRFHFGSEAVQKREGMKKNEEFQKRLLRGLEARKKTQKQLIKQFLKEKYQLLAVSEVSKHEAEHYTATINGGKNSEMAKEYGLNKIERLKEKLTEELRGPIQEDVIASSTRSCRDSGARSISSDSRRNSLKDNSTASPELVALVASTRRISRLSLGDHVPPPPFFSDADRGSIYSSLPNHPGHSARMDQGTTGANLHSPIVSRRTSVGSTIESNDIEVSPSSSLRGSESGRGLLVDPSEDSAARADVRHRSLTEGARSNSDIEGLQEVGSRAPTRRVAAIVRQFNRSGGPGERVDFSLPPPPVSRVLMNRNVRIGAPLSDERRQHPPYDSIIPIPAPPAPPAPPAAADGAAPHADSDAGVGAESRP